MKKPLVLLASGGTGGHIFPAEALMRELLARGADVALVTDKRGQKFSQHMPVPVYCVNARTLGRGIVGKILSLAIMGFGVLQAALLLRKLKPDAVVGFGGYPSVPLLVVAAHTRTPIVLHEQNGVLGRANKAMLPMAKILATSFAKIQGLPNNAHTKIVQTGNPVRQTFTAFRTAPYPALNEDEPFRLLVLGGSLGAHVFSAIVPKAIALLPEKFRRRMIVTQQCPAKDSEETRTALAAAGVIAEISPFFTDVPQRLAASHLVISRSGGGAVAELTAVGRPSILVPFPHGHAGEQKANAESVAEAGGAWIIPEASFTPEALAIRLEALMNIPSNLEKAGLAARACGTTQAAELLADCVYEVMGMKSPLSSDKLGDNPDLSGQESSLALSTREFYR